MTMFNCKARARWREDDDEVTHYFLTIHYYPDIDPPYLAKVDCSKPLCKRVKVLGRDILELKHNKDTDEYYLELAKQEAIRALRQWGIDVEEEVRC